MENRYIGFKKALDDNFKSSLDENKDIINKILFQIEIINEIINNVDNPSKIVMKEVIYDLDTGGYFGLNGLYRNAYISLRSAIELTLSYIYFVDHNYDYMFWKNDKYDVKWATLKNNEVGVLRGEYLKLFSEDNFEYLIKEFISVYHECSQFVHGKYEYMFSVRNTHIHYRKEDFIEYTEIAKRVIGLIVSILLIRYGNEKVSINETYKQEVEDILKKYKLPNILEKIKKGWQ